MLRIAGDWGSPGGGRRGRRCQAARKEKRKKKSAQERGQESLITRDLASFSLLSFFPFRSFCLIQETRPVSGEENRIRRSPPRAFSASCPRETVCRPWRASPSSRLLRTKGPAPSREAAKVSKEEHLCSLASWRRELAPPHARRERAVPRPLTPSSRPPDRVRSVAVAQERMARP